MPRSAPRRWRRPIRCACTTRPIIHYHRLELDAALDCAGRGAAHRPEPARRAFRSRRGAAAARRLGGGLGGIRMALPHRRCLTADATDRQAAMGRREAARSNPAARGRPGLWRRDPVRALHPLGGRTLPRHRDRLQRRDARHCCGRSRRPHGSSFAGRTHRTYAAFCPLSGLPRLAGTRIDNVPAPIPYLRADPARVALWAQRLDGLVPAWLPARRRDLGRAPDTQQRSQPLGAAGGFSAAGRHRRGSRCWRCRRDRRPTRPARIMAARR